MSSNSTPERTVDHKLAWPPERRRSDMKAVVSKAAQEGWIAFIKAPFLASTYGLTTVEAERELARHTQEGEGK